MVRNTLSRTDRYAASATRSQRAGAMIMSVVVASGFCTSGVRAQIYPTAPPPTQLFPTAPPPSSSVNWPPDPGVVRAVAESDLQQAEKEARALISAQMPEIIDSVGHERLDTIIRDANLMFERVIRPRLENASLGCHEAKVGLVAWVSYWPFLEKFGIADNPDVFPIVDGKPRTNSFDLPDHIFDTLVGLCASEAHDRCVATGDLPYIFTGLTSFARIWEMLGQEMRPGWINAFVRAAQACGQWTLSVKTDFAVKGAAPPARSCCGIQGKMHRDITLRWEPNGSGMGNIYNSTIVGESDVAVDALELTHDLCVTSHEPPRHVEQAKAKILGMDFSESANVGGSDKVLVTPRHLWLAIQFGEVDMKYSAHCPEHMDFGPAEWPADELELSQLLVPNGDARAFHDADVHGLEIADNRPFSREPDVPSLWTFSSTPFRADLDVSRADTPIYGSRDARLTLRLTHTPH